MKRLLLPLLATLALPTAVMAESNWVKISRDTIIVHDEDINGPYSYDQIIDSYVDEKSISNVGDLTYFHYVGVLIDKNGIEEFPDNGRRFKYPWYATWQIDCKKRTYKTNGMTPITKTWRSVNDERTISIAEFICRGF